MHSLYICMHLYILCMITCTPIFFSVSALILKLNFKKWPCQKDCAIHWFKFFQCTGAQLKFHYIKLTDNIQ